MLYCVVAMYVQRYVTGLTHILRPFQFDLLFLGRPNGKNRVGRLGRHKKRKKISLILLTNIIKILVLHHKNHSIRSLTLFGWLTLCVFSSTSLDVKILETSSLLYSSTEVTLQNRIIVQLYYYDTRPVAKKWGGPLAMPRLLFQTMPL